MAESRTRPLATKSRQRLKLPGPPKTDPANFIPTALRRNLPVRSHATRQDGAMEYMGSETSSVLARYDERLVREQLEEGEEEDEDEDEDEAEAGRGRAGSVQGERGDALPKLRGKQYKWSG
eukprot:3933455-Rhodomonas_salina.3